MNNAALQMIRPRPFHFIHSTSRRTMAATLATVFAICLAGAAAGASPLPQDDHEQTPTVRERVMAMPPHTLVRVRLHNKNLKGRVRIATPKGFVLEFAADGKTKNEKIHYNDVQSIDTVDENVKGNKVSVHILIEGGSGGGVDVEIDH